MDNLLDNLLNSFNGDENNDNFFNEEEDVIKLTTQLSIEVKDFSTTTTYKEFENVIDINPIDQNITIIETSVEESLPPLKRVSYSQYSKFKSCPQDYYLSYVKGIKSFKDNIHNILGTAIHRCLQEWLIICYTKTFKEGDKFNNYIKLKEYLIEEIKKAKAKPENIGNKGNFVTIEELTEAYNDGVEILEFVKKHRGDYFNSELELIGIEVPLDINIKDDKLNFVGFLDLVFRHKPTSKIYIKDIKCTYGGWSADKKKEPSKKNQLLLYKNYYAKNYNVKVEDIEVEYFILRRKTWESDWGAIKRVQLFKPAQSIYTVNDVIKDFDNFLHKCFDLETGQYNSNLDNFKATPSKEACKWCAFNNNKELCSVGISL